MSEKVKKEVEGEEEEFFDCDGGETEQLEQCEGDEEQPKEAESVDLADDIDDCDDEELPSRREEVLAIKSDGNEKFKEGDLEEAEALYTTALSRCPRRLSEERCVLYANRAACRMRMERKDVAVKDCSAAIELNPDYLKARLRRAQLLYDDDEKLETVIEDYDYVISKGGGNNEIKRNLVECRARLEARNEKLKAEMMGKLKDLGNVFLRPFGLSTDNFNLVQNESGGYSVNFQQ